ncbi:MAG: hypothetical protein LBL93_02280, partial [Ruminococcus sp.]|nr:hypothetical protein [Ruminococcus sp.]
MKRRKTALMLIFVMLFTNCISVFGDVKQDILDIKTSKYDYDGNGVVDIFDLCIFKYDLLHEGDDIVPPEPGTEPTGEVTTEPGTEPTGEVTTEPG